jgi:hypothetical protein
MIYIYMIIANMHLSPVGRGIICPAETAMFQEQMKLAAIAVSRRVCGRVHAPVLTEVKDGGRTTCIKTSRIDRYRPALTLSRLLDLWTTRIPRTWPQSLRRMGPNPYPRR